MNCFTARKEFVPFWRRELALGESAAFLAHLRECDRCDHDFRTFALTAPVIHGQSDLVSTPRSDLRPRALRLHSLPERASVPKRLPFRNARPSLHSWSVAAAAVLMLILGGFTAWTITYRPAQDFSQALMGDGGGVTAASYTGGSGGDKADSIPPLFESIAPDTAQAEAQ